MSIPLVVAGGVSSIVLMIGVTPTFSGFAATISNSLNASGTGTLVMQELNGPGSIACLSTDVGGLSGNAATCSSINKYGGDMGMSAGESAVTVTYIKNVGTLSAVSFSLTPGPCVQTRGSTAGTATDLCAKVVITITSGSTTIFSGTSQALGAGGPIDLMSKLGATSLPAGSQTGFAITTTIDSTAGNAYQGLGISQPMTWTFGP